VFHNRLLTLVFVAVVVDSSPIGLVATVLTISILHLPIVAMLMRAITAPPSLFPSSAARCAFGRSYPNPYPAGLRREQLQRVYRVPLNESTAVIPLLSTRG